ncbi:MAG: BPL-N domain-containing protein [Pirellulaceae bacterium]|nr:BPL-N domain-containing protein [Pirellulaceae bacterium]
MSKVRVGFVGLIGLLLLVVPAEAQQRYALREGLIRGPTVLVLGVDGVSGECGRLAVRQIAGWPVRSGRLLLAPISSGLQGVDQPGIPSQDKEVFDRNVSDLRKLLSKYDPQWVIVLREDYDTQVEVPSTQGKTIRTNTAGKSLGQEVISALHKTGDLQWRLDSSIGIRLSSLASTAIWMTVTTSAIDPRKDQRPARRIRQHRIAVHAALTQLEMIGDATSVDQLLPVRSGTAKKPRAIRVAIYDDEGSISSSGHGPLWILHSLQHHSDMRLELITRKEIDAGVLTDFDVLVIGGGKSNIQGSELGAQRREAIRQFLRSGGGYVGICAGGFLACSERDVELQLIEAAHDGTSGSGIVTLDIGRTKTSPAVGKRKTKFSGGPIFHSLGSSVDVWATYETDLADDEKTNRLKGTPAVIAATYGKGRVVAFSPHCERPPGPQELFWRAIRWSAASVIDR